VARLDRAGQRLDLSVTELVAGPDAAAALPIAASPEALLLGRLLHRAYQQNALRSDPSYRSEVRLALDLEECGWRVSLHGRADGVRREQGGCVLEELKTGGIGTASRRRAAVLQTAIYGWMLERQQESPVRCELVWLGAGGAPEAREPVLAGAAHTEARARESVRAWLSAFEERETLRERWRASADRIRFPHAQVRPGQERIAAAVEHALVHGEQLLVEAPTGLGKSASVLTPALRVALATGPSPRRERARSRPAGAGRRAAPRFAARRRPGSRRVSRGAGSTAGGTLGRGGRRPPPSRRARCARCDRGRGRTRRRGARGRRGAPTGGARPPRALG
jgi:DNA excision repair protein ERCC-2